MNISPQCHQSMVAYHRTMVEHYNEQLNNLSTFNFKRRSFIKSSLEFHQDELARLIETQLLAQQFNVSTNDLLQLANLVRQRMDADENVTVDYNPNRIVLKDHQGCVLFWLKAPYYSNVKTATP